MENDVIESDREIEGDWAPSPHRAQEGHEPGYGCRGSVFTAEGKCLCVALETKRS